MRNLAEMGEGADLEARGIERDEMGLSPRQQAKRLFPLDRV
jgi:hypothetical protein